MKSDIMYSILVDEAENTCGSLWSQMSDAQKDKAIIKVAVKMLKDNSYGR